MDFDPQSKTNIIKPDMFKPETIAVVGVSLSNDRHPANVIYGKLHYRYPVRVYPVNPKGGMLMRETVFPDIADIPDKIDLAVIVVRAEFVPRVMEHCIKAKVGGAVVISGGFAEIGRADLQQELTDMAKKADFPFIGPNCIGIYAPDRFDTFFLPGERLIRPAAGNVAMVSQSGGVLVDQLVKFAEQSVGLSLAVSIGNKALVDEIELLNYLSTDPNTRVIAFYIEGFGKNEGRRFITHAKTCPKPIVVLKAGKTADGTRAVSSHTASLAGDYRVFSQILSQYGIIEAQNENELISYCEALSCYNQRIGNRVGIVSVSGGHGTLATDACADKDLSVPVLSEALKEQIREKLSPPIQAIASLANPIDVTGSAMDGDFVTAARTLSESEEIDAVLMLLLPYSPGITMDLGARISLVYQKYGKPIVAYVPHDPKYRMLIEGFELNRVPVSSSIEGAVLMLESLRRCRTC